MSCENKRKSNPLHSPLLYVEFTDCNPDDVWVALSRNHAEGVLAHNGTQCFALLLRHERVLYAMSRTKSIAGTFTVMNLENIRNTNFKGLTRIAIKQESFDKNHISIDSVAPHGQLLGWAHSSEGGATEISLSIDGESVETILPERFRRDLLEQNIGKGCTGFSQRLPDRYLDGNSHEIKLELNLRDDPRKKVIARTSKQMKLPFHFNLPRPWITSAGAHAVAWTSRHGEEHLDIRHDILEGDFDYGLTRAADFITRHPCAVFKDFGLSDRYRIESLKFSSFGNRVTHRWGQLFGSTLCEKGAACCKTMDLPYNSLLSGAVVQNAAVPDTWEEGGFLDTCPYKIRHFASKELTQKYASQFNIHTPDLYTTISSVEEFDAFSFPDQYVLKPDFASGIELYLMHGDLNLFDGFRYSKDTIRSRVAHYLATNLGSYFIVEEFLCQDVAPANQPIIPLDYKIHCFGNRARVIHIDDKNAVSHDVLHRRQSWLSRDWAHAPYPIRAEVEHPNGSISRPKDLEEMYSLADKISADLGDYVRVDMYATTKGPVLGEISSFTHAGLGFTDYGDTILGQCWEIFEAAPTIETAINPQNSE
jgi:teichuronopeptide biosynthesis TupA-like protein